LGAATATNETPAAPTDPEPTSAVDSAEVDAGTWSRFRGPNGTGIYPQRDIATKWSDSENIYWSTPLPGAGSSSPILTEKHVFITSYTGYGAADATGSLSNLQRHLSSIDRATGKIEWTATVEAAQPDDAYQGMGVPEHGYATNTPVTDGSSIYVFFGKSGVLAYDMQGQKLWQTDVGKESGNRAWGTASSLVLYKELVIVNAAEESRAIIALDKKTGQERWRAKADGLELAYGTPIVAKVNAQRDDLIIAVPGEVWGLNPDSGKLVWYVTTSLTGNLSPSVILDRDRVYVFGGYRSSGSMAIRIGGEGDVTQSHVIWKSRNSSYVSTPILRDSKLYWIDDRGTYYCIDAENGELIHRSRVSQIQSRERPVYASPISAGDNLLFQTRYDGLIVTSLKPTLEVIRQNSFRSDTSMFNASPAADSGELYLRSDEKLYCIKQNLTAVEK
jgi:outer membrane protein assembly factor BamB